MQYNVAQLLKETTGATRKYSLNEDLQGLDPELKFLGPLVGTVTLLRTNSGVLVTGELSTAVQVTCRRCWIRSLRRFASSWRRAFGRCWKCHGALYPA